MCFWLHTMSSSSGFEPCWIQNEEFPLKVSLSRYCRWEMSFLPKIGEMILSWSCWEDRRAPWGGIRIPMSFRPEKVEGCWNHQYCLHRGYITFANLMFKNKIQNCYSGWEMRMSHHFTTDIYFPWNCFSSLGRWYIGAFWLVKYSEKRWWSH